MNTKIIKLDINKPVYGTILAKQGDTQSRFLLFKLLDNSIPFNLTNRTVRVYAIKPDGTEVFNDLVVNDTDKGYCTLELTSQMLALAGIVKMELVVTELDKKLTFIPFNLEVLPSINSENAIVSTNEFTALINALASLSEYDNYKNEIEEARGANLNLKERLDNVDSRLDNTEREKTSYFARFLGFKFDGSDETEVLKYALNFKDNISIIFPNNKTIIITEPIISNSNGVEIIGNGTWVKVKDNCGILERMSNREFVDYHEMGIISAYGDNFKCSNLNIDVNCFNNSITDGNGATWYQISTNHGDATLPTNKKSSGFTGIHTYGHNAIIEYCNIKNGSWGGVSCDSKYKPIRTNNCIVRHNVVEGCLQDAIDFVNTDGAKVYMNTIKNTYYHSIHSYNSNFNAEVYNNEIIHTADFVLIKPTPNADISALPAPLHISHSNYPQCESQNIKFYNNDIRNYSSIPSSFCICLNFLSFTRNVDIANNYIYNYSVGIISDVYNYGDINIRNNKIERSNKPIVIKLDPLSSADKGLPTFTNEIPNSKINITDNNFIDCNYSLFSEGSNADKHTSYCTSCVINEFNNKHLDKKTEIFKLHSDLFSNVSLSQACKKKTIVPLNDWILTTGANYRNEILIEYTKNEAKVDFDISNGTSTDLFHIENNGLNEVLTYPAAARVNGVWKSTVVQVSGAGKVYNVYLESGTSRIIGSFIYPLI